MEADYIRRKPLITVTVEAEVGGEEFLIPQDTVCVSASVLMCVPCHVPQCLDFSTCPLFWLIGQKKKGRWK